MTENSEPKVVKEVAEEEFERWAEAMDLDINVENMSQDTAEMVSLHKSRLVDAIMDGSLVVDGSGGDLRLVFTPRKGGPTLTFPEPKGEVMFASDQKKLHHNVAKTFAVIAAWTGKNVSELAKLHRRDGKVCESIFGLFFG